MTSITTKTFFTRLNFYFIFFFAHFAAAFIPSMLPEMLLPPLVQNGTIFFSFQVVGFKKCPDNHWLFSPPYCVSKLIQFLNGCYRFYIYRKYPKINPFQKGKCTHA